MGTHVWSMANLRVGDDDNPGGLGELHESIPMNRAADRIHLLPATPHLPSRDPSVNEQDGMLALAGAATGKEAQMHSPLTTLSLVLTGTLILAACGSLRTGDRPNTSGVTRENGGLVLTGESLGDGQGDLIGTMVGKVPNFRVRRLKDRCPQITLRNAVSYQSVVNPHIYVDGARATDTCILESLHANDVQRVEVYPTGVTIRPGYGRHAHGLILIFMRSGISATTG